jgi:glycosyltransferase involved in cell wall biosynthesis
MRVAVCASHPIQYQAPLFRALAREVDLKVFYAHRATAANQAAAGFGTEFLWDVDLLTGYEYEFLNNRAASPATNRFGGCDTPDVGTALRNGRFDAVVLLGWHLKSFQQALWACKVAGIPVAVRGDSQLGTFRRLTTKVIKSATYPIFLRLFDAALVVGTRSREYWERYRYPTRRIFLSPHAVDNDWFAARAGSSARARMRKSLNIPEGEFVALFAGKLLQNKRPLDLIDAAAVLKARGRSLTVLFAGSGPLETNIANEARRSGVSAHLLGFRNQSEMPETYAAADALVLPSENETWGLVANEALACMRPVVLSDRTGAAPDLAGDGRAGRVFATGQIDELASALTSLMDDSCRLEDLQDKVEMHSVPRAVGGVLEALQFLVRKKG